MDSASAKWLHSYKWSLWEELMRHIYTEYVQTVNYIYFVFGYLVDCFLSLHQFWSVQTSPSARLVQPVPWVTCGTCGVRSWGNPPCTSTWPGSMELGVATLTISLYSTLQYNTLHCNTLNKWIAALKPSKSVRTTNKNCNYQISRERYVEVWI